MMDATLVLDDLMKAVRNMMLDSIERKDTIRNLQMVSPKRNFTPPQNRGSVVFLLQFVCL